MYRRIIGSLVGLAAVVALSTTACAGEKNPIFRKAVVKVNTASENKAVSGKGYYADYYGYYGNYYNYYAGYFGHLGYGYKNYSYYYNAYVNASYSTTDYYWAYYYQYYGL